MRDQAALIEGCGEIELCERITAHRGAPKQVERRLRIA
jgi:hypothetical protein